VTLKYFECNAPLDGCRDRTDVTSDYSEVAYVGDNTGRIILDFGH